MPVEEVSYKNAAQNTVKKSLSRKYNIEIVVKKVSQNCCPKHSWKFAIEEGP